MRSGRQRILRWLTVCALVSAAAIPIGGSGTSAQTGCQPEDFSAWAVNRGPGSLLPTVIVDVRVTRWSTEREKDTFARTLLNEGPAVLLKRLREAPSVGVIRTPFTFPDDIVFAWQETAADGGRQIILITDRPMIVWKDSTQIEGDEDAFTVVELRLSPDGDGEGKVAIGSGIAVDRNLDLIVLEDYASAPVRLIDVRSASRSSSEERELRDLYRARDYRPLWIETPRRISVDARTALHLLARAAEDGIGSNRALEIPADSCEDSAFAAFDVRLSASLLRYFRELHLGRVDPRTIGVTLAARDDRHDFAALLQSAVDGHSLAETAAGLRPRLAQYDALRSALARYRSLSFDDERDQLPRFAGAVRPGDSYSGVGAVYRRLLAFGDLSAETPAPAPADIYQGVLVAGVKRFQSRHGLASDGVIGAKTHVALSVPVSWRIRQLELALERLRWLPDLDEGRLVVINIPMFRLWMWDSLALSRAPSMEMAVIVGRALRTQTPVFVNEIREVVFRPYWNVPRSILRHEILPRLERNPDYLAREDMEIVRGDGDGAPRVAASAENIERLKRGTLRVRQRPGPRNALGLVKFVFPNEDNVYMHGTPAQALFQSERRDFSHGCVRVEDPVSLAEWALRQQPGWTREKIVAATAGTRTIRVKLAQPIPVVLFYTTAVVMPEDGTVRFADDVYNHDSRLHEELTRFDNDGG